MKLKIKTGDMVQVIAGANRGKQGKVLEVQPEGPRVLVEGVNQRKRHVRASQNTEGGIVEKEAPIHYSNVQILDQNEKPTRVAKKLVEKDGKQQRVRVAKSTGEELDAS